MLPFVGRVFSLFGIFLYHRYLKHLTYSQIMMIGNVVGCLAYLSDVVLFLRWNLLFGIEDKYFVLGSTAFENVVDEWLWLPSVILLSQMCPKDVEAIMYALLAGCSNLGSILAGNFGAAFMRWLGVTPAGRVNESAAFEKLWIASLISSALPTVAIVLIPFMIPNKKQTEVLIPSGNAATDGSLLRRWFFDEKTEESVELNGIVGKPKEAEEESSGSNVEGQHLLKDGTKVSVVGSTKATSANGTSSSSA